jgi:hypothetical protein
MSLILKTATALLAIVFNAYSVVSNLRADEQSDGAAVTMLAAAFENCLAIKNYDVIIRHWRGLTPHNEADLDFFPGTEDSIVMRFICDRDRERCSLVKWARLTSFDGKSVKKMRPTWTYESFQHGERIAKSVGNVTKGRTAKSTFLDFMRAHNICFFESSGITAYTFPQQKELRQSLEDIGNIFRGTSVRQFPDGTCILTANFPKEKPTQSVRYVVDTRTLMPVRFTSRSQNSGRDKIIYSHTIRYEEIEGLFRTKSIQYEKLDYGISRRENDPQAMELDHVGTVDIEWMQFNVEKLQFPEDVPLASEATELAKYLKLTDEAK